MRLEHEDLLDQMVHRVMPDHKDLLEMLVIQDRWVQLARGVLKAQQGKQAKTEKQAHPEILGRWASLAQLELEDFQGHPDLQD